jgi:hypothetical protein
VADLLRNVNGMDEFYDGPSIGSTADRVDACVAALTDLRRHVEESTGLSATEQSDIARVCRELHRHVDDIEVEASSVI